MHRQLTRTPAPRAVGGARSIAAAPVRSGARLNRRRVQVCLAVAAAAAAAIPCAHDARGATKTWIAGSATWNTAADWSGGTVPATGDTVDLFNSATAPAPTITFDGNAAPAGALSTLIVDATNTGSVTLAQTGGLLQTGIEYVGLNGSGLLSLSGGTHQVNSTLSVAFNPNSSGTLTQTGGVLSVGGTLLLADDAHANATYNQSGGSASINVLSLAATVNSATATYNISGAATAVNVTGNAIVGVVGLGTISQSNGTVTFNAAGVNGLLLGNSGSAAGVYNLSGGTLNFTSGTTYVGYGSTGRFNQTGGTFNSQAIFVGGGTGAGKSATGVYNLAAGTLNANQLEAVGYYGTGTFNQSNGANVPNGGLIVGYNAGSVGTYNMTGGTLNTSNEVGIIGYAGLGMFNQSAGTTSFNEFVLGDALNVFSGPFGTGVANLSGGTFNVGGEEDVGQYSNGSFNQTGGAHTVSTLYVGVGVSSGGLVTPGGGTFTLGGGTLLVTTEAVGHSGIGSFLQSAGTHTVSTTLTVGDGSSATFGLTGGTLNVAGNETIGDFATGNFSQSNGAHTVGGTLIVSGPHGGAGAYALQGGVLNATAVVINPNGTFTQSGGALFANSFTLAGGTITGTLQNQGTFTYASGNFAGRLLNQGAVTLPATTPATFGNGVENDSAIAIGTGQTLTLNGQGLDNFGTFELAGGTLGGSAVQTNDLGGVLSGHGTIAAPLNNLGTLTPDGTLQVNAVVTNAGRVNLPAGTVLRMGAALNNTGEVLSTGGGVVLNGAAASFNSGVLTLASGGGISGSGASLNNATGGRIQGAGVLSVPLINTGLIFANASGPLNIQNLTANGPSSELRVGDGSTLSLGTPLTNFGEVRLLGNNASLTGQPFGNNATIRGFGQVNNPVNNGGVIVAENGNLQFTAAGNLNSPGGRIQAGAGNTVTFVAGLFNNGGSIELGGGTFDNNNASLTNIGSIVGNGTLRTGGLFNNGSLTLADAASSVYGPVTNNGSVKITNTTATFYSFFNNAAGGTVKTTGATARYLAGASVGGTYISDPSTQTFTDLSVTSNGAIQAGAGDQFVVTGSYSSASTNAVNWNTSAALLRLTGGGTHGVTVSGTGGPAFAWGQFQVDAPDTAIISGSGAAGGFQALATVNAGAIQQPSGVSNLGALTGGGSLSVGGAGATAVATVTSFAQNSVTVADGGTLQLVPNATHFTNTAGLLTLGGSGTLQLVDHHLLTTATPLAQVRSYLLQARNGGSWTGVGGINSSTVKASPITFGMAYFSGANPANATLSAVPGMSNPNAVFVRPAQIGDFNGDGIVDRFDIRQFNTRGSFNDGGTNHDWADGDLNNDGVVDRFDIRAFNTAGNFNNGVTFAAAQPATLTTKASATPAVAPINSPTTVGITGDGKPDLVYDPSTGDVIFKYDGFVPPAASPLVEMEIDSAKGSLRPNNASQTVAGTTTTSADGKLIDFANLGPTAIADGVDLGQIFPTNSNALALTSGDISVSLFLYHDQTGSSYFADVVGGTAGVPEPTSLALLGVAAAGLLGRRRRRRAT